MASQGEEMSIEKEVSDYIRYVDVEISMYMNYCI